MIKDAWANLNERDQKTLLAGIVLAVIMLIYNFVYSPLSSSIAQEKKDLIEQSDTLAWMIKVKKQFNPANTKQQTISNNKLLSLMNKQLGLTSLKGFIFQLQQGSNGDVQLSFERVPYEAFIDWLWELNKTYHINIKQVSIEQTDTAGVVKVALVVDAQDTAKNR